jgi:hypothetical protein
MGTGFPRDKCEAFDHALPRGHFAPGNRFGANRLGERAAAAQPASGVSLCRARNFTIQHEPLTTKIWVRCGNRRQERASIGMTRSGE